MANPKPTAVLSWATSPPAGALLEPSAALVANGYSQNSKPAYNTFNWLFNTIGQWLAYLETLDQSFTWQDNGLFSADPTLFGPASTTADGSDARIQNAGAYAGFALYYSPLGQRPTGPSWNAFYNGSNFEPYQAGTPAYQALLDPATGQLRFSASAGAATLATTLSWTDALALTADGKVLVNRTTDDGTGATMQATSISEGGQLLASRYLALSGQAADSAKLGGVAPSSYAAASSLNSLESRVNGLVTYGDGVVVPRLYTSTIEYTTDSNGYFNMAITSPTIDLSSYLTTLYGAIVSVNYSSSTGQASWGNAWVEIGSGADNVPTGHIRISGFCQGMFNTKVTVAYLVFGS